MIRFFLSSCVMGGWCLLLTGCDSKPARVSQPSYSSAAGAAAIEAYDSNADGAISGNEFDRVGALRAAIASVDADGDGRITADEIDARINAWKESKVGQMAAIVEVKLDGKPLPNAEVVFDPEPFVGSNLPSGTGTTETDGMAGIAQKSGTPGMPCGFYKIRVTSPDRKIPAKYNSETTLGCEVANYSHWQNAGAVKLNLTSK